MPPEVSSFLTWRSSFSLHHFQAGTVGEQGVILPTPLPLTSERLERHGLYLIEDGQTIFLWIGRDAVPRLVMDVFNLPSYELLRGGKVGIRLHSEFHVVVDHLTNRQRFLFLTMSFHNGSTLSSRKHARCAEACTTHIFMWLKRMASHLCGSGLSAASYKTVPMFYRAISSSLDN